MDKRKAASSKNPQKRPRSKSASKVIKLTTGQPLLTDSEWCVLKGGDFAPDDLVECHRTSDPVQTVAYYAQYIATGGYSS